MHSQKNIKLDYLVAPLSKFYCNPFLCPTLTTDTPVFTYTSNKAGETGHITFYSPSRLVEKKYFLPLQGKIRVIRPSKCKRGKLSLSTP